MTLSEWRAFWVDFRAYWSSEAVVARIYAALMRRHRPQDVGGDAFCLTCVAEWPCAEWTRLDERRSI